MPKPENLPDEQLVNAALNAAARAGISNSGICISASASYDWEDLQTYKRELLRRFKTLRAAAREEARDAAD